VVQAYEGLSYPVAPRDYPGERGFLINIQTLVGHGYAVLVASLPLPKTQPDPMADLGGRLGGIVDAMAADPDLSRQVDLERVALWGQSYGGYTVMAAIAQTDRFRAAVALSGLSDLISKWETMPAVYRAAPEEGLHNNWSSGSVESGQDRMGAPPWVDPGRYIRNSPLFLAPRIRTPLLLIHGDQDVIPLPQSEAMFSALFRQDKDAMLITYFGEGHVIVSPGNVRDLYRRAFAFLDAQFSRGGPASAATPPRNPEPAPASGAPRPRW
jgi:dipeptidyl aminopeptidase/acylaminoacyl peptidase